MDICIRRALLCSPANNNKWCQRGKCKPDQILTASSCPPFSWLLLLSAQSTAYILLENTDIHDVTMRSYFQKYWLIGYQVVCLQMHSQKTLEDKLWDKCCLNCIELHWNSPLRYISMRSSTAPLCSFIWAEVTCLSPIVTATTHTLIQTHMNWYRTTKQQDIPFPDPSLFKLWKTTQLRAKFEKQTRQN